MSRANRSSPPVGEIPYLAKNSVVDRLEGRLEIHPPGRSFSGTRCRAGDWRECHVSPLRCCGSWGSFESCPCAVQGTFQSKGRSFPFLLTLRCLGFLDPGFWIGDGGIFHLSDFCGLLSRDGGRRGRSQDLRGGGSSCSFGSDSGLASRAICPRAFLMASIGIGSTSGFLVLTV